MAKRAGGKTIAELTAFCKKLQEEKEVNDNSNGNVNETEQEEAQPVTTHHPFLVKEKPDFSIPPVIFPVSRLNGSVKHALMLFVKVWADI